MDSLKKRLPDRRETQMVLGFLVFVVFSWSVRGFLYRVTSFLLYFDTGEVLSVFFYMMAFALLESLLVLGGLLLLTIVLPGKWFRVGFSYKASLIVLVTAVAMILLQGMLTSEAPSQVILLIGMIVSLVVLFGLNFAFYRIQRLQSGLNAVLDRFTVFTYLYIPLGIVGLLVVLVRNLF
jgi:hypothetical protein